MYPPFSNAAPTSGGSYAHTRFYSSAPRKKVDRSHWPESQCSTDYRPANVQYIALCNGLAEYSILIGWQVLIQFVELHTVVPGQFNHCSILMRCFNWCILTNTHHSLACAHTHTHTHTHTERKRDKWRFSTAWYGTVRFGTVHFWGFSTAYRT